MQTVLYSFFFKCKIIFQRRFFLPRPIRGVFSFGILSDCQSVRQSVGVIAAKRCIVKAYNVNHKLVLMVY
jgi:hypothetical protein